MATEGKGSTITFPGFTGVCIKDINSSGRSVAMYDAVCMDSTNMEKQASSLVDFGTVTATFLSTDAVDITTLVGTTGALVITTPDGVADEGGDATLTAYSVNRPVNGLINGTATFTYTGVVTP